MLTYPFVYEVNMDKVGKNHQEVAVRSVCFDGN